MKIQQINSGIATKKRMMSRNLIYVNALRLMQAELEMKKIQSESSEERDWFNETLSKTKNLLSQHIERVKL